MHESESFYNRTHEALIYAHRQRRVPNKCLVPQVDRRVNTSRCNMRLRASTSEYTHTMARYLVARASRRCVPGSKSIQKPNEDIHLYQNLRYSSTHQNCADRPLYLRKRGRGFLGRNSTRKSRTGRTGSSTQRSKSTNASQRNSCQHPRGIRDIPGVREGGRSYVVRARCFCSFALRVELLHALMRQLWF